MNKNEKKIKFYIPEVEKIPTKLRLKVNGKDVFYERVNGKFAYDFSFFDHELNEAMNITKEIAIIMCDQSYDHGASWKIISIEEVKQEERYCIGYIIRVNFRMRDAG